MTGLYQRKTTSGTSAPGLRVNPSQGAGAAVPSGASLPAGRQNFDASALGGLLGLFQRVASPAGAAQQGTGASSPGVFNASLMPGAGNALALGAQPSAGNFGPGVPSGPSGTSGISGAGASGAASSGAGISGAAMPGAFRGTPAAASLGSSTTQESDVLSSALGSILGGLGRFGA